MKKMTKNITIIASGMIVIGIILAVIGYSLGAKLMITNVGDGFHVWSSEDRKTETIPLSAFTSIDVNLLDADLEIIPANEYKLKIDRHKDQEITYKVDNNKLIIEGKKQKKRQIFSLDFGFVNSLQTKVEIYVPKGESFSDINVVNNFGDTYIEDIISEKLMIHMTDGDLSMTDIQANELKMINQFGDITGNNMKAKNLDIEMTDGDGIFKMIEVDSVVLNNDFGNTEFEHLTSQGLNIKSIDGDLEIDGLLLGHSIIDSSFGDVDIELLNKESELSYDIRNQFGDITINDNEFGNKAVQNNSTKHKLEITAKDGDIDIKF